MDIKCSCGALYQLDERYFGKKVKCTKCGTTFDVPRSAQSPQPTIPVPQSVTPASASPQSNFNNQAQETQTSTASPQVYNTIDSIKNIAKQFLKNEEGVPQNIKKLLHPDENVRLSTNPSFSAFVIKAIVLSLPILLFAIGSLIQKHYVLGLLMLIIVLPLSILIIYLSWKHSYYIITDKRTLVKFGIFNVRISIVPNNNIQIFHINTGLIDRWLGLNTVVVSSGAFGFSFIPGSGGGSIVMKHLPKVDDVFRIYGQSKQ